MNKEKLKCFCPDCALLVCELLDNNRKKFLEEVEEIIDNLRKSNDMWRMNQDEMGDFILKQLEGKK